MHVIGAGVGRTGTNSLRLALNQLGLGPCHHMDEVIENQAQQVPLWQAAAIGEADWPVVYEGYQSAVDWPTARFFRELQVAYPTAKFVLTTRSAESWVSSFSQTIYKVLSKRSAAPEQAQPWLDMCVAIIEQTGFYDGMDEAQLAQAFEAHNRAVQAAIPADQLLIYEAREGWEPLCAFLDVPVPATPFPKTNNRTEFFDLIPWEV
ncbi:MAG: sulfotransferase family protein [Pseudomonadota bacterium]